MKDIKTTKRRRRHHKIRTKIYGTENRPRLVVFKSNKHIYAQIINDDQGTTLASVSDVSMKKGKKVKNTNISEAEKVGKEIASKAKKLNVENVVFDRGGFKYHGLIKAVAEGARKDGLKF